MLAFKVSPDSWEFSGGIGEKYKQIGNAVPVELARRIGLELIVYQRINIERGQNDLSLSILSIFLFNFFC